MRKSKRLDPGLQALQKHIWLPCEGFVIGERVSVIAFEYDGNERRAVTATCRRADGRQYEVAASEVVIPPNLPGADYLAAYRQWMGLDPYPPTEVTRVGMTRPRSTCTSRSNSSCSR